MSPSPHRDALIDRDAARALGADGSGQHRSVDSPHLDSRVDAVQRPDHRLAHQKSEQSPEQRCHLGAGERCRDAVGPVGKASGQAGSGQRVNGVLVDRTVIVTERVGAFGKGRPTAKLPGPNEE